MFLKQRLFLCPPQLLIDEDFLNQDIVKDYMQINLLKKVVENTAGIAAVKIVDLLSDKKDVNEFLIAKRLDMTINQTRNLLYKLSHLGILSSIRKKDKRKGWYIYFWTINVLKSLEVLEQTISKEIEGLKGQLNSKQTKRFYICKMCGREVNEESSLLTNFICSECGEVYDLADTGPAINEISKAILKLEKEVFVIREEIMQENQKKGKKLKSHLRREESKKKEIRAKARKEREKLRAKERKLSGFKPLKKKVKKKNKRKSKPKKKKI